MTKRRRKLSKDGDGKPPSSEAKRTRKGEGQRGFKKGAGGKGVPGGGRIGSIQCLINAATLLEEEREGGRTVGTSASSASWKELWSADNRYGVYIISFNFQFQCVCVSSPWCDKYDTAEYNRFSESVRQFVGARLNQLKSEAVVGHTHTHTYTHTLTHTHTHTQVFGQQEYNSMENHTHPQVGHTH